MVGHTDKLPGVLEVMVECLHVCGVQLHQVQVHRVFQESHIAGEHFSKFLTYSCLRSEQADSLGTVPTGRGGQGRARLHHLATR